MACLVPARLWARPGVLTSQRPRGGDPDAVTQLLPGGGAAPFLSPSLPAPRLGTLFLWIFWPSFNSAPTTLGDGQHRTALNTYYSLTASTLSTFALSALIREDRRLDMVQAGGLWGKREELGGGPTPARPTLQGTSKGAGGGACGDGVAAAQLEAGRWGASRSSQSAALQWAGVRWVWVWGDLEGLCSSCPHRSTSRTQPWPEALLWGRRVK